MNSTHIDDDDVLCVAGHPTPPGRYASIDALGAPLGEHTGERLPASFVGTVAVYRRVGAARLVPTHGAAPYRQGLTLFVA